jgi:hypothetical protein
VIQAFTSSIKQQFVKDAERNQLDPSCVLLVSHLTCGNHKLNAKQQTGKSIAKVCFAK